MPFRKRLSATIGKTIRVTFDKDFTLHGTLAGVSEDHIELKVAVEPDTVMFVRTDGILYFAEDVSPPKGARSRSKSHL